MMQKISDIVVDDHDGDVRSLLPFGLHGSDYILDVVYAILVRVAKIGISIEQIRGKFLYGW